jgi:Flp pilus assembly protein TadD
MSDPSLAQAAHFFQKGVAALASNDANQALQHLKLAEGLAPGRLSVLENIAAALLKLDRFQEARAYLDTVLSSDPDRPMALLNRAGIANHFDDFDAALTDLKAVVKVLPGCHEAWNGIGIASEMKGEWDTARSAFFQAIRIKRDFAEAHQNLALLDLAQQNFRDGWWRYEWRWENPNYASKRKFPEQPGYWDGKSPLLVWGEHGVGDQILYGTYLSDLLKLSDVDVYFLGNAKLNALFKRAFRGSKLTVISEDDVRGLIGRDIWNVPMASIPHFMNIQFGRDPSPSKFPYLKPALDQKDGVGQAGIRIGISWKSKNEKFGARKSALLSDFVQKAFLPDEASKFVNLQYGDINEDTEQLAEANKLLFDVVPEVDKYDDILGLVNLIGSCDVVVTTSNTTAHLAGAIGTPTFVLLPQGMARFWYWHRNRADSPWYESVHLVEVHQGSWSDGVRESIDNFMSVKRRQA